MIHNLASQLERAGTQLAPQQLGLMGMEALETVIGYWEDALAAYNPTATRRVLTTNEETEFIRNS